MLIEWALALTLHATEGNFNDIHPTVRIYPIEQPLFVTAFFNSESAVSVGVGYTFRSDHWFADAGLLTGYDYAPVLPMVRMGYEWDNVRAWVAPSMTPEGEVFPIFGVDVYW